MLPDTPVEMEIQDSEEHVEIPEPEDHVEITEPEDPEQPDQIPRRSGRSTAGQHTNLFHLPRSAVQVHYLDLGTF